jgi:hypothetical protein
MTDKFTRDGENNMYQEEILKQSEGNCFLPRLDNDSTVYKCGYQDGAHFGYELGYQAAIDLLKSDKWLSIADEAGICGDIGALSRWLEEQKK